MKVHLPSYVFWVITSIVVLTHSSLHSEEVEGPFPKVPTTISTQAQEFLRKTVPSELPRGEWKASRETHAKYFKPLAQAVARKLETNVQRKTIASVPVYAYTPKHYDSVNDAKVLIHLHGGGYTHGSAEEGITTCGPLAELTGLRVYSIDYRLAPEHPYPGAVNDCVAVYAELLREFRTPGIGLIGESAGGALVLATLLKVHAAGLPMPAAAALMSPWADITKTGDTYDTLEGISPLLRYDVNMGGNAKAYAGTSDMTNPLVSPVYADYPRCFPPTIIQTGTRDMFLSNCARLNRKMKAGGVDVELSVWEGMWHAFHVIPDPFLPEAQAAQRELAGFLCDQLNIVRQDQDAVGATRHHVRPRVVDPRYELTTVVNDTALPGCNGAAIGADGALYVVHAGSCSVSRIDLSTLKTATYVPSYTGVSFPDDVTADDRGNLFITGTTPLTVEVYRVDRKGKFTVIASHLNGPNGIQYNQRTGRLFVTECFWGSRILELDPTGRIKPKLLVPAGVIPIPEGFDFDRLTHDLIVPDMKTGRILRVHPDTGTIQTIADGFSQPVALKVGADNMAYIAEIETGNVYRLNLDTARKTKLARLMPGIDNLAVTAGNRLFVTSFWNATVFEVTTDGSGQFKPLFPMGPIQPYGLVVKNDKLLVSDVVSIRVVEDHKYGDTQLNSWVRTNMPAPIALGDGPDEQVVWADLVAGVIAEGTPSTGRFRRIGEGFNRPVAVLVDSAAHDVFVVETAKGQITKVHLVDNVRKVVARGLVGPTAITKIGATMYVAESAAGRISRFDPRSETPEVFCDGLGHPCAIASDGDGNLLVIDGASRRLLRIGIADRVVGVVAEHLPINYRQLGNQMATIVLPTPMAVDSHGNVYIATASRGVIALRRANQ